MATLTKAICDAAQPALGSDGKPRETTLWDGRVPGFGLRVRAGGGRSFVVTYRPGGRASPFRRVTLGAYGVLTVEQARTRARTLLGRVAEGHDPAGEAAAKRASSRKATNGGADPGSVAAVVAEWLIRDQAGNRSVAEVRRIMANDVLPALGSRPLAEVRKRDIIALVDAIADRGSPIMANRTLAHVRRMLNWAAGRDLIEVNPAQFVERVAPAVSRDRVLEDGELAAVWRAAEAAGGVYGAGVRLLILTGARLAEIFEAAPGELRADGLHLPAERAKSGQGRIIPLTEPALAILTEGPEFVGSPFVLTTNGRTAFSGLSKAKAALDTASGVTGWRIHDLRRTVATGLQRLGFRLEVIEAVLGHIGGSRAGIVGVYNRHRFEIEKGQALEAWARHVLALADGAPSNVVSLPRRAS